MMSGLPFLIFIAMFLIQFLWERMLTLLNMGTVKRNTEKVPEVFSSIIDPESYGKSVRYTLAKGKFSLVASTWSALFLIGILVLGLPGICDVWIRGLAIPAYGRSLVFIGIMVSAFSLAGLPISLYGEFRLERNFGFGKTTARTFILDMVKSVVILSVLGVPILLALFFFIDSTGRYWWIISFLFLTIVELGLNFVYPLFIAPLFNRFTKLPDGELKSAIMDLAGRLDFPVRDVYVMDGSKRSGHSNAYFSGFGKSRRIVLFDTLITSLSPEAICGVICHEIGHWKKHHLEKGFAISLVVSLAGLKIVDFLMGQASLYTSFGFQGKSLHALLFILAIAAEPCSFFLTPLFSALSRRHEYEADRYAVEAMGSEKPLVEALERLDIGNLTNLTPHPLFSFYAYSHPAPSERRKALDAAGRGLTGIVE
jgi:STE24 endopeptidase